MFCCYNSNNATTVSPPEEALFKCHLIIFLLAGQSFDDYMNRVSGILAQKMSAIQLLQDQIKDYQERFCANRQPRSTP